MNSLLSEEEKAFLEKYEKQKKGVSRSVTKNEIMHNDYDQCMNTNKQMKKTVFAIVSKNHQIQTIKSPRNLCPPCTIRCTC